MHVQLVECIAHCVAFGGTRASQRIVAAAGIGHDREQGVTFVGQQLRAACQIDVVLCADRIVGAVTLAGLVRVIEQRVDRLIAFQIEDAQQLSSLDSADPRFSGGNDGVEYRRICPCAIGHCCNHEKGAPVCFPFGRRSRGTKELFVTIYLYSSSVLMKPRSFSGQRRRHTSSRPDAPDCQAISWIGRG